ncbi:hypothetical protein O3M35_002163 [Rhynocoris fuscipes]|uniref:Uncharacterized protein n=1 Tax=Rhynocoris fuscipes TaxID=488301 RepID=A0AAW1CXM5_9HEMI
MDGLEDVTKVCRLCLQGGEVMCPIFTSGLQNNGTVALPYRIMSCARVRLIEGDGLPPNVCASCLAQVDRSYQFKLLCERTELTLRGVVKGDSSSDTESLDGGESWDMTKFTPEVIIKEDADEGLIENGLPSPEHQLESFLSHQHSHHPLYPLHQVEELLRNHGTEIKVQADQQDLNSSSSLVGNGHHTAVPVSLGGQPAALLVAHRLVPVMGHHHQQQGGAVTHGAGTPTAAVLVATTAPTAAIVSQQPQKQQPSAPKVTIVATPMTVTTKQQQQQQSTPPPMQKAQPQQQQQHNGNTHHSSSQQQQKSKQQTQNDVHHHSALDSSSLSSRSRRCRGGDKLFKCSQCNKSYSFSSALSRHKAVHNKELRPHICKVCNKGFTHPDKLTRHQKTHSMDVFMSCDVCNRPFKSYPAYQKHKQSGNCESGLTVNDNCTNYCEFCNCEFDSDKTHICSNGNAADENTPQVATSAENSPSNNSNNREEKRVEPDEEPVPSPPPAPPSPPSNSRRTKGKSDFKCKVCEKYFATKGSLEVHSTIHTGVRPFVCSACGKSFRHKVNLMEHFQRKHSQVRPYICDVCAARFVTKQELVRHYRKHIGD